MNAPTSNLDRASLRALLAVERDVRRRPNELARAGLLYCVCEEAEPGTVRPSAGSA